MTSVGTMYLQHVPTDHKQHDLDSRYQYCCYLALLFSMGGLHPRSFIVPV